MKLLKWQQSFDGVEAALKHIGLVLVNTKEEFDQLEVPLEAPEKGRSKKRLSWRKVTVSREGVVSKATAISSLLSGNSSLLTAVELHAIQAASTTAQSITKPKGIATNNIAESRAIDELNDLIASHEHLQCQHLMEQRLADNAYSLHGAVSGSVWLGNQVKHCVVSKSGQCSFMCDDSLTVKDMLTYLRAGLSLTCIGKTTENKVDVVWFFHGEADIKWLSAFVDTQRFQPRLRAKNKSSHKFTKAYSARDIRFDVGSSTSECKRLLQRLSLAVETGVKQSLEYLNEDLSQVPRSNFVEHQAFSLIRAACALVNVIVQRLHQDAYGQIDFRVIQARIQDKTLGKTVTLRKSGGYPYNPDDCDILQFTDSVNGKAYALPTRIVHDGHAVSFHSGDFLMKRGLRLNATWKDAHKEYLYNLNSKTGILAYVAACTAASQIPQLTDRNWYSNLLAVHADKFGSPKQVAEREANAKKAEEDQQTASSKADKPKRVKTSQYIGVSQDKYGWRATLKHKKVVYDLGRKFKTEHDAARARNAEALELLGDDAKLQVILDEQDQPSSSSFEYPLDS